MALARVQPGTAAGQRGHQLQRVLHRHERVVHPVPDVHLALHRPAAESDRRRVFEEEDGVGGIAARDVGGDRALQVERVGVVDDAE